MIANGITASLESTTEAGSAEHHDGPVVRVRRHVPEAAVGRAPDHVAALVAHVREAPHALAVRGAGDGPVG